MVFIFTDGASRGNGGDSASAFIVMDGNRELKRGVRYVGRVTNNMAEYFAVYDGVVYCYQNNLLDKNYNTVVSDSQLIINQLIGGWKINNSDLKEINDIIKYYINDSGSLFSYEWVPRTHHIIRECDKMNNQLLDRMVSSRFRISKSTKTKSKRKVCRCK